MEDYYIHDPSESPLFDKQLIEARNSMFEDELVKCQGESRQGSANIFPIANVNKARMPRLEESHDYPVLQTRVAGVSFENRQGTLSALRERMQGSSQENTAVMLEHEPSNPYDPNAIKVSLLDGQQLGYVPRTVTPYLTRKSVYFGRIAYIGCSPGGYLGALIHVQPSLVHFTLTAIPDKVFVFKNVVGNLREDIAASWVAKEVGDPDKLRCAFTGEEHVAPPNEVWEVSLHCTDSLPTLTLQGLRGQCFILGRLDRTPLGSFGQEELVLLAAVNRWSVSEARDYWKSCVARAEQEPGEWAVDISLLRREGLFKRFPRTFLTHLEKEGCTSIEKKHDSYRSDRGLVFL